ncbi:xylanase [Coprinopsis sp. MPI-PUGE-AT-0042]|nr:xylanase [Coprinopsis sp. MPI-PUGE-AT-0042]
MKHPSLLASAVLAATALSSPFLKARAGTPNSSGVHNGFYYSWTSETQENAIYKNEDAGTYSIEWYTSAGRIVGGKGWNPGDWGRVIKYNGTYQPNGYSSLGVYGWTRNALVEYMIIESFGNLNPASSGKRVGSTTCSNGVLYDIYRGMRYNSPSIDGTQTFEQFWSVRHPRTNPGGAVSGVIDTGCHFSAWRDLGMQLGKDFAHQIFATEGWFSSGNVTITVS